MRRLRQDDIAPEPVAGNGLLDRRIFLAGGAAVAAGAAQAEPLPVEPYSKTPGAGFAAYGQPSKFEAKVGRIFASAPGTTGTGASRTPLHLLDGMITPNGLHFERSHAGIPDIDPDAHKLLIHGLVRRPLIFTLEALARYPMESRITFLECAGNGQLLNAKEPAQAGAQGLQGLVSCAEWTGVRLAVLLQEAGVDPSATWILAEGADAAGMSRSVPLAKAMDDALIALYQNGERVRPSNGYPMRLLLPGFEGNMNVKWLRRIKLTEGPTMTKDETSKYTILQADGKALQFVFPMEAKSLITQPSPGLTMKGAGLYEISGLAWSGYGKIAKVEVSADGGKSFAPAALQEPVLSRALTRFRLPWRWDGGPAVLQSRATDDTGYVQPTRAELFARRGPNGVYHHNGIMSWSVAPTGELKHVYA
jgi:sulfane dehydrogenase subunit SoxC